MQATATTLTPQATDRPEPSLISLMVVYPLRLEHRPALVRQSPNACTVGHSHLDRCFCPPPKHGRALGTALRSTVSTPRCC
mgnify:CR=1 FL=1